MSKKPKRKNVRQSDFKVIARGIHRDKPDFPRLMQATLDHYMSLKEGDSTNAHRRPADRLAEGVDDDIS